MPPPVARELSITYAGVTVGGASEIYLLDGPHRLEDGYESASVSCRVVVNGATEAAFAANCAALEAAYRTPRGTLVVTLGAETLKSFSHAANTGYSAIPSITKAGDVADSGRARAYECKVTVERPADLAGQSGRRESNFVINTEPGGRRTCTLTGKYTALGANAARAQYDANGDDFATAVLPDGAQWRIIDRRADSDDPNKNLTFDHVYEEVLSGGRRESLVSVTTEPGGRRLLTISGRYTAIPGPPVKTAQQAYDDGIAAFIAAAQASILPAAVWQRTRDQHGRDELNQNLTFAHEFEEVAIADGDPGANVTQSVLTINSTLALPGDSPEDAEGKPVNVRRLTTYSVTYSGFVSVRAIAPAVATTPVAEYTATIRPWILRRLRAAYPVGAMAIISESVSGDPLTGQVQASLGIQAGAQPGGIVEYNVNVEVVDDPGRLIIPVWAASAFAYLTFTGPRRRVRTIQERIVRVSGISVLMPAGGATTNVFDHPQLPAPPGEGTTTGWISLPRTARERRIRIGSMGDGIILLERDVMTVQQWIEAPSGF